MWHRSVLALSLSLVSAFSAQAQVSSSFSRAIPPDKAAIERLNLKTEWTVNLAIDGRRDSISLIQTLDDQVFVQTRTGGVVAIDALTGRIQWSVRLGNGSNVNTYAVATNSQFVYVANVTKLYSFHRYTGVVEFVVDLETPPTTGLAADDSGVYCILGVRTGSSGVQRIAVYDLPRPIVIAEVARGPQYDPTGKPIKDPKSINPVDSLMTRYPLEGMPRANVTDAYDTPNRSKSVDSPSGGQSGSRTPSLSALPRVSPPYTLDSDIATPAINLLPSLRQPYRLHNDFQKDIQQTASINAIPPSLASALALTDLRPKGIEPHSRWEYGASTRLLYPVSLTPKRVWAFTDAREVLALNKIDKKTEISEILADPIAAPAGRADVMLYVPLSTGYVLAIDGSKGQGGGPTILWRSAVGGLCNRTPFVTESMVYSEGDNCGVACVDRKTGDLVWRSDNSADRLIAANKEFVYIRDRRGRILVYDAKRATDPLGKQSSPLASIDLSDFNIPITNTASDRLLVAADNGLIVCMRDLSPKYARPVRICPAAAVNNLFKDDAVIQQNKEAAPPKDVADPKGEPKKEAPKKVGM